MSRAAHQHEGTIRTHRQPWTPTEIAKLRQLAEKGMSLKAISKSLTRSEESILTRAKIDKLVIAKKR